MSRVYTCIDYDPSAGTCNAAAWIEQPSILDALPTPEQAHGVGLAFFISLVSIAAMSLLLPNRASAED